MFPCNNDNSSPNLSAEVHTGISSCLLSIYTWLPNRQTNSLCPNLGSSVLPKPAFLAVFLILAISSSVLLVVLVKHPEIRLSSSFSHKAVYQELLFLLTSQYVLGFATFPLLHCCHPDTSFQGLSPGTLGTFTLSPFLFFCP